MTTTYEIRRVVPMVRDGEATPHWPVGSIGGRLEDGPIPPGWKDLPEGDERYSDYKDWKVKW